MLRKGAGDDGDLEITVGRMPGARWKTAEPCPLAVQNIKAVYWPTGELAGITTCVICWNITDFDDLSSYLGAGTGSERRDYLPR
jgi:hypothetical protein